MKMHFDMETRAAVITNFAKNSDLNDNREDLINAFRYLRNLCATNPEFQSVMAEDLQLLESSKSVLHKFLADENEESNDSALCLVVGFQFLANLLVNNKKNQISAWQTCRELFESGLKFSNAKVQHCCLMIMYNIFLGNSEILSNLLHAYENILELAANDNSSEYAVFIVDLFICHSTYLVKFYHKLNVKCKLLILDEIQRLVKEQSNVNSISAEVIKLLADQFSKKSDWILNKFQDNENQLKVIEAVKTLETLVAFSCDDEKQYLEVLQKETSLFINCVALLKAVHSLSKEGGNNFTMVNKLSELSEPEAADLDNPVFGFKAALIRIIGNMCWKNKKLQDIIRDLEGIQIILDCCNIDGKNPYITQWSILAICNICEKNTENQKVIALMSKEGDFDAKTLQEAGIVLNSNDNGETLSIAPLHIRK